MCVRIQVHASLLDYLERLQRQAEGERVSRIIVSCRGRVTMLRPDQIRDELRDIPRGVRWDFLAHGTLNRAA